MARRFEKCSFCFKSEDEVRRMAGPNVHISQECVGLRARALLG
jgi:ClpX C4-type zinc finger